MFRMVVDIPQGMHPSKGLTQNYAYIIVIRVLKIAPFLFCYYILKVVLSGLGT